MKYYAHYDKKNNELSKGQIKCLNEEILNIEINEDTYNNLEKYKYENGKIIINTNYEEEMFKKISKVRKEEITEELKILDTKRIRAICEPELKDKTKGISWLEYYNEQIKILRDEYNSIN